MCVERDLEEQLKEAGNKLLHPPPSPEELLPLLDKIEGFLSRVDQVPAKSMRHVLSPVKNALIAVELLKHSNVDVKVAVTSCISEITRITAPDAPYDDDRMKDVFHLIVSSFENLPDKSSRSYDKRGLILETFAKVRLCVVMLDLECDGLIAEMFQLFLATIRDYHPSSIFSSMETIMTLVVEESEDISPEILTPLLATMRKDNKEVLPIAVKLAEKVFVNCAAKLKPFLSLAIQFLDVSLVDYSDIVTSVFEEGSSAIIPSDGNAPTEQLDLEDKLALVCTNEDQDALTQVSSDEESWSEDLDSSPDRSPKMLMGNGVDEAGTKMLDAFEEEESGVNVDGQPSSDKGASIPEIDNSEAGDKIEFKPDHSDKKRGNKLASSNMSESSDTSHVEGEEGAEELPDLQSSQDKETVASPAVSENLQDDQLPRKTGQSKKRPLLLTYY